MATILHQGRSIIEKQKASPRLNSCTTKEGIYCSSVALGYWQWQTSPKAIAFSLIFFCRHGGAIDYVLLVSWAPLSRDKTYIWYLISPAPGSMSVPGTFLSLSCHKFFLKVRGATLPLFSLVCLLPLLEDSCVFIQLSVKGHLAEEFQKEQQPKLSILTEEV